MALNNGMITEHTSVKMKSESVVYDAARDGKLNRLKAFLVRKSKKEKARLVSAYTNGSTPLIIACRNGHSRVASYLLEKCNADIEQGGSLEIDGEKVYDASPLWFAARVGHLNLVKYLLKRKAFINSTTKTKSTPLRAACFCGHFGIARYLTEYGADIEIPNVGGDTCLMIACYKGFYEISEYLIKCGADVNRKNDTGYTALHYCAESGHLHLLKLLLRNGATLISDSSGMTPLLIAAIVGASEISEFLMQEFIWSKHERIHALELLGAYFIDVELDMKLTLKCWKKAMKLRYEDRDCIIEKPETTFPMMRYFDISEVRTLSQLEELATNPDEMRMQALLVRERILGSEHTSHIFYVRKRGLAYAESGDFQRCIKLWMYALNNHQDHFCEKIYTIILNLTRIFSRMISDPRHFGEEYPRVSFIDIFHVFNRAVKCIEFTFDILLEENEWLSDFKFHQFLSLALHLVGMISVLQPPMTKNEELYFKETLYRLVRLNPKGMNDSTLLHIACCKDSTPELSPYQEFEFPSVAIVDFLLEVGATPNVLDSNLNTPLHAAAMNKPFVPVIFNCLLNHGAHLDQCNAKKQTPFLLAQQIVHSLDVYPLKYINLQCLSAKAIQYHNIPYKGFVHTNLEVFIDAH